VASRRIVGRSCGTRGLAIDNWNLRLLHQLVGKEPDSEVLVIDTSRRT
jgi:hypothetical protein